MVNALSSRLDVEVDRGGKTYAMSFRRGEPGRVLRRRRRQGRQGPRARRSRRTSTISELEVIGTARRGVTGTRVRYWADRQIFLEDAAFDLEGLVARARQTSFLVPGLTIVIRDQRGEEPTEEVFLHDGGISEFCEFLAPDPAVTDVWRLQGTGTFKETVPVLDAKGHMSPTEVERECAVDVAVRWGTGYDTRVTLVRQHHRHAQGRHPPGRLRPGPAQGAAHASSSSTRAGSRSAATSSRRTTPWRA